MTSQGRPCSAVADLIRVQQQGIVRDNMSMQLAKRLLFCMTVHDWRNRLCSTIISGGDLDAYLSQVLLHKL